MEPAHASARGTPELLQHAILVVIVLGNSQGINWEIEQAVSNCYDDRLVILVPEDRIVYIIKVRALSSKSTNRLAGVSKRALLYSVKKTDARHENQSPRGDRFIRSGVNKNQSSRWQLIAFLGRKIRDLAIKPSGSDGTHGFRLLAGDGRSQPASLLWPLPIAPVALWGQSCMAGRVLVRASNALCAIPYEGHSCRFRPEIIL